jgi:hypothetical protein
MCASSVPSQADAVLAEYKSKVQSLQVLMSSLRTRKTWALAISLACFALLAVSLFLALKGACSLFPAPEILFIAGIWQLRSFLRCGAQLSDLARRSNFYEHGIDRVENNWRGKGRTGLEFAQDHHLYQADLDILGTGSLFELIATARTEVGAERIASFLLDLPAVDEARARQDAVRELRSNVRLREEIAILGKYQFQNCRGEHLRDWLDLPILHVSGVIPLFLLFSGTASLLLGLCGYARIFLWLHIVPVLVPLLLIQAGIGLALMRQVRTRIKVLLALCGDISVLRQGIELVERQQFQSAKLRELVQRLRTPSVAVTIRQLQRLLFALERREDALLYPFSLWLAAGTQLVLAIERWRVLHQNNLEDWLDAWSEFEALNAFASYSWEHPHHVFPELLDGDARFEAVGLGHPLLPGDRCVGNDVVLNASKTFYVVSGSNMAGKSTFLRAIGLNAVLASAGAPVCASSARTAVFRVCASISVKDSLREGKSKFLAEVERLRESVRAAEEGGPVLFLIDEILSGTNSRDRRIAAEALIQALVAAGAVGALSTHDLALTQIGENLELRGVNAHMESEDPEEPLAFDYRIKPGISRQTNALAIIRMMGMSI